jgi:7-carboxy-7-deazaguanine synthase
MERMKTYPLAPDGVFWTLQGEGALQGEPMAFVRLAGCSVGCAQCDTDYRVSRRLTCEEIVEEVRAVVPPAFVWPWVWITGGEPTDHDLAR